MWSSHHTAKNFKYDDLEVEEVDGDLLQFELFLNLFHLALLGNEQDLLCGELPEQVAILWVPMLLNQALDLVAGSAVLVSK